MAMSLQRFTRATRPADVFDGGARPIERLMPETHVVPFDPDSDSDSDPDFLPPLNEQTPGTADRTRDQNRRNGRRASFVTMLQQEDV